MVPQHGSAMLGSPRHPLRYAYVVGVLELMSSGDYWDYLRTPHWRKLRKEVLARAGERCERCGIEHLQLEINHKTYARRGHETLVDLEALCRNCHAEFHGRPPPDLIVA